MCYWDALNLFEEPESRHGPVALYRSRGHVQDACNLLDGQAGEVAQFDDLGLPGIDLAEIVERIVDGEQFRGAFRREGDCMFDLNVALAATSKLGIAGARVVDENAAHHVCGDPDKVLVALPIDSIAGETQIGLVDKGGRLKGVVWPLPHHVGLSQAVEFVVDERQELVGGG